MRESFGGAFMIKLALIFIVIYVTFMACAISYAKAFRVKNSVINILEQNQYSGSKDADVIDLVDSYLQQVPYNYGTNSSVKNNCSNLGGFFTGYGVCIVDKSPSDSKRKYYQVTTYIAISFPLFDLSLIIPISGETKTITAD